MSAVERRRTPETRPSRNQDFKHHRPWPPLSRSTWRPDGPRSAHHTLHRRPVYVSFVSKAVLWDREVCSHTAHDHPHHHPSLCPRFLSHMKSHPDLLGPPHLLSSKSKPQPLSALKTHTLEGEFTLGEERKINVLNRVTGRRSAVMVPCPPLPPLPAPPASSNINPNPSQQNTPQTSGTSTPVSQPASPPSSRPKDEVEVKETEEPPQSSLVSMSVSDMKQEFDPAELDRSSPAASVVSHRSPSEFSHPPCSLFSCSTDPASGRSSVLLDAEGSVCLSPLRPCSVMLSPLPSNTLAGSNPCQSTLTPAATTPLHKQVFGPNLPLSPRMMSGVLHQSDKPPSRCESEDMTEIYPQAASTDPAVNTCTDSNPGLFASAFHSATWSSCPTPPRSGSGPQLSPPTSLTQLESHRWPVPPPISPGRGRCGTAASRYSELSCSQSHVFDELEAIAPRSTSCPSLDQTYDSSCYSSPDTDLSPGLAALTVGCDSGNLGSISRVQLLLLDRNNPETTPSPFGCDDDLFGEEDWSDLRMQDDAELTSAGVSRPLTAGSGSESCDSAGKVQENNSDDSEGDTGSPSSWIIDQSPSYDMFRSADSHCLNGSGGEERRKALNMLSKLQDDSPRQTKSSRGCSNFEDFDFLAKFCVFSQEMLAEYKRAFEAEDVDGDGYISSLQVALALKHVFPAALLSDEEEIYVYRILELVDFRVTDGLVDLRLFAVIADLARKIATMDDFMRSLISDMDLRSLKVPLFKVKQLFLSLLEEQRGAQPGFISTKQLLLELKARGIRLDQEATVKLELQLALPLDLLHFLAYLPLFMLMHKSVLSNRHL